MNIAERLIKFTIKSKRSGAVTKITLNDNIPFRDNRAADRTEL